MRRYTDWIRDQALPVWAERGWDAGAGRFHERLDLLGAPVDVPHRAMVQARQVYVYAHAALLGWFPEGGRLAETALAALRRDFVDEEAETASAAFSIRPDGARCSEVRDAYAHAFLLFALAWAYRLTGDTALVRLAEKVARFVDAELADPRHGGLFDAVPGDLSFKRQNPLMHLLEAYLAMARAAPGGDWLERARGLAALFGKRLVREGRLIEYFAADWGAHPRGGFWEPGHHFEWVWLLHEYGAQTGEDLSGVSDELWRSGRALGLSDEGRVFDEVALDGAPLARSSRVWPHTEGIKAAAVRGDRAFADAMAGTLLGDFLDRPFAGGWVDQLDAGGAPKSEFVPASTLYHLFFAAAEADAAFPD